jgi:hypothetical protein
MPLSWEDFQRLVPHLDDVFSSFLRNALGRIDGGQGGASQFDALELLDRLVTSSGYRNIIAQEELIQQLPLKRVVAERLLEDMDHKVKLVRRESRRGGYFVEIIHERLIPPVRRMLAEMRHTDTRRAALGPAYDMLYVLPDDPDPTRDTLPFHFREALEHYRERLQLDRLAAKNLLRSMLVNGPQTDGRRSDESLARSRWGDAICKLAMELSCPPGDRPDSAREPLLAECALDRAIAALQDGARRMSSDAVRHLAWSVLADRSDAAGRRILRSMQAIAARRYQL